MTKYVAGDKIKLDGGFFPLLDKFVIVVEDIGATTYSLLREGATGTPFKLLISQVDEHSILLSDDNGNATTT